MTKNTGCKGAYSLMKLPHHDPIVQTAPDAMHTIKDAIVNIFDLITGKDDTMNCRTCEFNLGERFGITQEMLKKKIQRRDPNVPYSLSSAELAIADKRALAIVSPVHIGFVPGPFFSKSSSLKSHDWKQVHINILTGLIYIFMYAPSIYHHPPILQILSQGIFKYCLHGLLGCDQRRALFQFIDICNKVLSEKQKITDVPGLLSQMNTALTILERDIPITIQVSSAMVYSWEDHISM
jgi:hypothetical protein